MAFAVHLPGDGRQRRANNVDVEVHPGSGTGVYGKICALSTFFNNNRSSENVWVMEVLVIDDDKGLRLHSDLQGSVINAIVHAEVTVVKWSLVLPASIAHSCL